MKSLISRASMRTLDSQTVTSSIQINFETRENYRKTTTENVFSHPSYREMIADIVRAKEEVEERKLAEQRQIEQALQKKKEEERIKQEELRKELAKVKVPVTNRKNHFSNRMQSRKEQFLNQSEDKENYSPQQVETNQPTVSKNVQSLDVMETISNKVVLRERPRRNTTPIMMRPQALLDNSIPASPRSLFPRQTQQVS
ncbi:predicted protein [Naegleria gruberi]|uniref:Predicted protein n=1 Tax=Naegleria gruberi TaxID=5762 RepID=D2VLP1_NAEGR|nr:uncharacterized protein NAEGRDRAFT_69850 [Naegleria gruberi]EFC42173.1 predicted protein [Naegleria gruberi]|eukprot:XP_002674917.1 predicted protein [Naegleria gruberi strain NEG-M]